MHNLPKWSHWLMLSVKNLQLKIDNLRKRNIILYLQNVTLFGNSSGNVSKMPDLRWGSFLLLFCSIIMFMNYHAYDV